MEHSYAKVFAQDHVRPALVADGLAEIQITWPSIPIVFCDTRKLAQEWTYRWLAAAYTWATTQNPHDIPDDVTAAPHTAPHAAPTDELIRTSTTTSTTAASSSTQTTAPSTREVRAWACDQGMSVPNRGRLRPDIFAAWHNAHTPAT